MKRYLVLTTIFCVLVFSQAVAAQTNFKTYSNPRFGFSILYPAGLLKPQGESANGDGKIFRNADAEMRAYGSNLLLNDTMKDEYDALLKKYGSAVTYKFFSDNSFVISRRQGGKIYYQKTIENAEGAYITFLIEYKESKRATYDKIVTRVAKSFKV